MRKLGVVLAAAVLAVGLTLVFSGSAFAAKGGEKGGNACPKDPSRTPPNCGKDKDGEEPPPPPPPGGVCENADLVLLRDLSEDAPVLICLYGPGKGAFVEEECEGATIAESGPTPLDGGICVFLPPPPEGLPEPPAL